MTEFESYCMDTASATGAVAQFDHHEGGLICFLYRTEPAYRWIRISEHGPWGEQLAQWAQRSTPNETRTRQ